MPTRIGKENSFCKGKIRTSFSKYNIKTQHYFLLTYVFVYYLLKVCAKKSGQKLEDSEMELNVKGYISFATKQNMVTLFAPKAKKEVIMIDSI